MPPSDRFGLIRIRDRVQEPEPLRQDEDPHQRKQQAERQTAQPPPLGLCKETAPAPNIAESRQRRKRGQEEARAPKEIDHRPLNVGRGIVRRSDARGIVRWSGGPGNIRLSGRLGTFRRSRRGVENSTEALAKRIPVTDRGLMRKRELKSLLIQLINLVLAPLLINQILRRVRDLAAIQQVDDERDQQEQDHKRNRRPELRVPTFGPTDLDDLERGGFNGNSRYHDLRKKQVRQAEIVTDNSINDQKHHHDERGQHEMGTGPYDEKTENIPDQVKRNSAEQDPEQKT